MELVTTQIPDPGFGGVTGAVKDMFVFGPLLDIDPAADTGRTIVTLKDLPKNSYRKRKALPKTADHKT